MQAEQIKTPLAMVAATYGVSVEDITSRRRSNSITKARSVCHLIAREVLQLSYPDCRVVCGRDHSAVLYSVRAAQKLRPVDPRVDSLLERFESLVNGQGERGEWLARCPVCGGIGKVTLVGHEADCDACVRIGVVPLRSVARLKNAIAS